MKKLLLRAVSKMIELLEHYQSETQNKIQDCYQFNSTEFLVKTDTGYHPVSSVMQTRRMYEWKIITENRKTCISADTHMYFDENKKCKFASDFVAGDKICTVDGISEVKYCYPIGNYSRMYDIEVMSPDHRFYSNGILSHNTICSAIFITWYLLFNVDKNVMVLANKGATSAEILDKIKAVLKGLPFFLKPGVVTNNQQKMAFDNGCRVMGSSTSGTAAIGYTIHLAYMDEFAHIHNNFVESFYRSVYPTISSSKISRVIITSTPNGKNKFYDIYQAAVEKKNEYNSLRVDWWQVPGRDEEWKKKEVAQLGSEELFNQEYGNQFLSSDTLLLPASVLRLMEKTLVEYEHRELDEFEYADIDYTDLKWHPKFSLDEVSSNDKFVLSIDIADGAGKDYRVLNIFKVEPMSRTSIRKMRRERIETESDMFRLRQVGLYRSNKAGADEMVKIASILAFKLFNPDNIRVALEVNFKGDFFIEKFSQNEDYYDDMFLHTRHNERAGRLSIGIKIHKHNKMFFCREFRKLALEKRIILTEKSSYNELSNFGINNKGSYSSQTGHDDIAMTFVNLVPYIKSEMFSDTIEEIYDSIDENVRNQMVNKLATGEDTKDDSMMNIMKSLYDDNPFKKYMK